MGVSANRLTARSPTLCTSPCPNVSLEKALGWTPLIVRQHLSQSPRTLLVIIQIKLTSGAVEGGINIVMVKVLVNGNSNRYGADIVLDMLRIGLMSVLDGSEGQDCSMESFIVQPMLEDEMYWDWQVIVSRPQPKTRPEFRVRLQVAFAVVIVTEQPPEPVSAVPLGQRRRTENWEQTFAASGFLIPLTRTPKVSRFELAGKPPLMSNFNCPQVQLKLLTVPHPLGKQPVTPLFAQRSHSVSASQRQIVQFENCTARSARSHHWTCSHS